jgi:hypothetical protein
MVTCYLFFFVISFVLAGLFISRCLLWGSDRSNVSSIGWFLASFFTFFRWFWKPDLHFSAKFWLTYAPQPHSPPSSAPASASSSCVDRRWSVRGAHSPGSSLLLGAHEGHTLFFQAVHGGNWFYGVGSSSVWFWWRRVSYMHRRPESLASFSTADSLFLGVSAFLCLCYYLAFLRSQPACVWIKFYGNIYWLIARSTLFL